VIRRAKNIDRAVEAAKRRYERRCHVHDWSLYSDSLELHVNGKTSVISLRCQRNACLSFKLQLL
jgi:hypothetical protein